MTDPPNKKKRRRWRWVIVALIPYVLCMGPAFRLFGMRGTLPFAPILLLVSAFPTAGQPVVWYLNLWAPNGVEVQTQGHDIVISEPARRR